MNKQNSDIGTSSHTMAASIISKILTGTES